MKHRAKKERYGMPLCHLSRTPSVMVRGGLHRGVLLRDLQPLVPGARDAGGNVRNLTYLLYIMGGA